MDDMPYRINQKSLDKLASWLGSNHKSTVYRATKLKRHRKGSSSWVMEGEVYFGDAGFAPHPWTGETCMSFGRGVTNDRMWTSAVLSAKHAFCNRNVWFIRTYNSIYKLEIRSIKNKNREFEP